MLMKNQTSPVLDQWKNNVTLLGNPYAIAGKTKKAIEQPPINTGPYKPMATSSMSTMSAAMTPEQITAELTRKAMTPGSAAPSAAHKAEYDAILKSLGGGQTNTGGGNVQQPASSTGSMTTTSQGPGTNYVDMEKASALLTQLEQIQKDGFKYDYKTDPAYLAAMAQAQEGAKTASRQTLESMNDRGIVNSSVTSSQLGQIQQAAQNEPLKMIPALENNAYNRFQQNFSNQFNLAQQYLQNGQFQMGYDQSERFHEDENSFNKAQLTGHYMPAEAQGFLQAIMNSKQAYAQATTPEDRQKAAAAANDARNALKSMGLPDVDRLFGGGVTLDQLANNLTGFQGFETMAHRQMGTEDDHWDKTYGLEKDRLQLDKDKFTWDKSQPRGGSGGSGLSEMRFMIGQNTEQMLNDLRLSGINTPEEAMQWMNEHVADLQSGLVDPDPIWKYIDGLGKNQGGGNTPSPMDQLKTAWDFATKDPRWKGKPGQNVWDPATPLTPQEQEAIVQEKLKQIQSFVMPPAPPPPQSPFMQQTMLNRGIQRMNQLAVPRTPAKPPKKNGNGKVRHTR